MASIHERNGKYNVHYRLPIDENGIRKQVSETFYSLKEAERRKIEIEAQQIKGELIPPQSTTVKDFLHDFVETYGKKRWGVSQYDSQTSLIDNYINPLIGKYKVQDMNPRSIDFFIQKLQTTSAVSRKNRKARTQFVTDNTIERIIKLLHCAYNQAVRWGYMSQNPFDGAVLPKTEYKERDTWTPEMIVTALNNCNDSRLYVAMNLAFACSMRIGEILGLQWSEVHISDTDIMQDDAHLEIKQELERVSLKALQFLNEKDIYYKFKPIKPNSVTRRVLKKPKSDTSIRKVWLPKTVAYILRDWQRRQNGMKEFLGEEYYDYNLVVCLDNGNPCENRIIEEEFNKLKESTGLKNVVFHSLRHSSTSYKLKLSHGDIKAVQGDTGHAQADMVTEVYAHILDEDRKINAQKFDEAFYSDDMNKVNIPKVPTPTVDIVSLVQQIQQSPEQLALFRQLLLGGDSATAS